MMYSINLPDTLPTFPKGQTVQLDKVNYFFGKNGTGKSSIARYIRENKEALADNDQDVLIYDRKFKEDIMVPGMPGIYTFGSGNAELIALKNSLQSDLSAIESQIVDLNKSIEEDTKKRSDIQNRLQERLWMVRTELIEEYGSDWSSGFNGKKSKLLSEMLEKY